jgi:hypothetical protein
LSIYSATEAMSMAQLSQVASIGSLRSIMKLIHINGHIALTMTRLMKTE